MGVTVSAACGVADASVDRPDVLRRAEPLCKEEDGDPGSEAPEAQGPADGYFILKLWHEFIVSPPDDATLNKLVADYASSGQKLKPLLKTILSHSLMYESLDEQNMLKPPILYVVGAMRALGLYITDSTVVDYLDDMGQIPWFPPTVAGWEGGLAWLNTNTALARFDFVGELLDKTEIDDVSGETPAAAYDSAYAAVGSPWLAPGTHAAIRDYADRARSKSSGDRKERQLILRALMLAGPDGQVV